MFPITVGDLFRVPESSIPNTVISVTSVEVDDHGEVSGFSGFTPLLLPFVINVYRDAIGSFRVSSPMNNGTDFAVSFIPGSEDA